MLSSQIQAMTDVLSVAGLDRLAEYLPLASVNQALSATRMASIRRRRLQAEQVVWLVIALVLYRHQSMAEVLATLDLALPSATAGCVSRSAVTQARWHLGAEPMVQLFGDTAQARCAQDGECHAWKGLSLWVMDRTTFRTPDADNRTCFGAQTYVSGKVASCPHARFATSPCQGFAFARIPDRSCRAGGLSQRETADAADVLIGSPPFQGRGFGDVL